MRSLRLARRQTIYSYYTQSNCPVSNAVSSKESFANDNIDAAPCTDRVSMRARNVVP